MRYLAACLIFFSASMFAEDFSCPAGETDVMKYFVMAKDNRGSHFLSGTKNPIYTEVFPDQDFARAGYWFWLKSAAGHGFDVKAYDKDYVFMRATELSWTDSTTFKRFVRDLPVAARCVPEGQPGPEIKVRDTSYEYYSACTSYKHSQLGTALNTLDAPELMDTGANLGQVWTRVLHYRYNCNSDFQQCVDEEQFYLANGYGEWQWKHYRNGALVNSTLINTMSPGSTLATLPCSDSYKSRIPADSPLRP